MLYKYFNKFRKLLGLITYPKYRNGLKYGVAAAIEHKSALVRLKLQSVIDIGANKGQFSLVINQIFPDVEIFAFEPLEEPAMHYSKLFKCEHNVILHTIALGSFTEESYIHISGREDSSSLLPILSRQEDLYPGTGEIGTRKVKVTRGDDILNFQHIKQPLLIKLDIQGFEKEALLGMPLLLSRATYVYSEISFQELYEKQVIASELILYLHQCGFRLEAIYNLSNDKDGQPVYADALFKRI